MKIFRNQGTTALVAVLLSVWSGGDLLAADAPSTTPTSTAIAAQGAAVTLDASGRQQLQGHLTSAMKEAPVVARVPPANQLTLTIGLALKNRNALLDAANAVADPKSPSYRKYLTPDQLADAYGATSAEYQTLLDWGKSNSLTVTPHKNRITATFVGSVANIETALDIHLNYRKRPDGTWFFAPDTEPSIKLALPVEHISGLENFELPTKAGGSGNGGEYQGSDYRNAYAPSVGLTGAGQTIGIFMFDGFSQNDINGYATLIRQTFLPVQRVPASTSTSAGVEGTLDVEMSLSMAPAAQIVVFLGNSGSAMLANMVDRDDIKQFSSSWFWYDGTTMDETLMADMAMQGQSFFQASGDGGAYQVGVFPSSKYTSPNLDCRQFPFITIVGGTSLDMSDNGASYGMLETAWPASSGGSEASVPIPSYQADIAGHNGASSTTRNVPDVSAQAAGGTIVYNGAPSYVGGTSQATPLWAGFMALVNQQAANYRDASVGFANPKLYAIAAGAAYGTSFHDIVSGCTPNGNGNQYCAGTGYDLATGLGSPQAGLIDALAPGCPPGEGSIESGNGLQCFVLPKCPATCKDGCLIVPPGIAFNKGTSPLFACKNAQGGIGAEVKP
jgi:subtilase family serine protease